MSDNSSTIIFKPDGPGHRCKLGHKYFDDLHGTIRECRACGKNWRYQVYYYNNARCGRWYELGPVGLWWHTRRKRKKE
jgi:hypothetical protein